MNRGKNRRSFIFFLLLSLLVLASDYFGFLKPVKGFFEEKLVIPVKLRFFSQKLSSSQDFSDSCLNKDSEISSLKAKIAQLKEENLSARKLLGAPLPQDWKFIPTRVLDSLREEILIDKGQKEGIEKGMVALSEGVYLGKVTNVSEKIAKIQLLTFPEAKEVVKIIDNQNLVLVGKGLLVGKGGEKMEVREILAEEDVGEDDLVVASLESGDFPVGKIVSVSYQIGDIFKTAQVKREINIRYLETVFLVKGLPLLR